MRNTANPRRSTDRSDFWANAFEVLEPRRVLSASGLDDQPCETMPVPALVVPLVASAPALALACGPTTALNFSLPIDRAYLDALGDDLHTLAGDGDANPWKDQWIQVPDDESGVASGAAHPAIAVTASVQSESTAIRPAARALDLSWLDDGSGDGVTDADIYRFDLSAADMSSNTRASHPERQDAQVARVHSPASEPVRAIVSNTASPLWLGHQHSDLSHPSTQVWVSLQAIEGADTTFGSIASTLLAAPLAERLA